MAFQISDFTQRLTGDGARPNLFQVVMTLPGTTNNQLSFMAKAAQLPGSSIGTVPVYYFGREMKFAGNRTFADWTITVINDENFMIRNSIEAWMNSINSNESNVRTASGVSISPTLQSYTTDAQVYQYSKSGPTSANAGMNAIKGYNFVGLFPVDLSPIDLDWASNDTIEEFSVTFAYQYWTTGTNGTLTGLTT
jgi:T4-like virus tail tube protein gp19